mgnify:FL=1
MLKKKMIRKIIIATGALFALFLIYLIPNENVNDLESKQELEYINLDVKTNPIFLLNSNNYLGRCEIVINSNSPTNQIKELLQVLISGGEGENRIPNGFKSILPSDTKILSIDLNDGIVKINFSKELLDIDETLEEKMIEAIVYTVTTIDEVKGVIIYVDGDILTKLPKTKINLPTTLDRSFGINKTNNLTSTKDFNQVTIYYVNKYNDNTYYVPVTKYLNDKRDKISIVIDELTSLKTYTGNLMSYLNSNTKLLKVQEEADFLQLTFNSYIFDDVNNKDILEEVIYTICLSINDNYDVKEVIFDYENEEIYKTVLKSIE